MKTKKGLWLVVVLGLWMRVDSTSLTAATDDPYCGDGICQTEQCYPGGPGTPGDGCGENDIIICEADCGGGGGGGCTPSWQTQVTGTTGGYVDEHCVPLTSETANYWCECTARVVQTVHRWDANGCNGPADTYFCQYPVVGFFADYSEDEDYCYDAGPGYYWGNGQSCPY